MIALTLTAPLAYEANPGIVQATAPPGTTALRVLADGHSVHAGYPGLVRPSSPVPVDHKAGWLPDMQHDAAFVFPPRHARRRSHELRTRRRLAPGGVS